MKKIRLVNRTFDILELFITNEGDLRLSDIAEMTGLDKSTVSRIASTLVDLGYLIKKERRGKYSLGYKFLDFSGVIKRRSKLRDITMPHLYKLSKITGEPVILTISDGQNTRTIAYNETISAGHFLRIVPDEGTTFPLYCTANGKILLSAMSEEELQDYLDSTELYAFTNTTITDANKLREHLKEIARAETAFDNQEYLAGVSSVATGVRDAEGKIVASLGIMGPAVRLTQERLMELAPEAVNCVKDISKDLGFKEE